MVHEVIVSFLALSNKPSRLVKVQLLLSFRLPAAARLHHHVLVLFVDNIVAGVDVEDADRAEFGWRTAAGWHVARIHGVHQGLDDGMVGGLQVRAQGEVTDSLAVVGFVIQRGNNPIIPA